MYVWKKKRKKKRKKTILIKDINRMKFISSSFLVYILVLLLLVLCPILSFIFCCWFYLFPSHLLFFFFFHMTWKYAKKQWKSIENRFIMQMCISVNVSYSSSFHSTNGVEKLLIDTHKTDANTNVLFYIFCVFFLIFSFRFGNMLNIFIIFWKFKRMMQRTKSNFFYFFPA